jgi:hypothetical protein
MIGKEKHPPTLSRGRGLIVVSMVVPSHTLRQRGVVELLRDESEYVG